MRRTPPAIMPPDVTSLPEAVGLGRPPAAGKPHRGTSSVSFLRTPWATQTGRNPAARDPQSTACRFRIRPACRISPLQIRGWSEAGAMAASCLRAWHAECIVFFGPVAGGVAGPFLDAKTAAIRWGGGRGVADPSRKGRSTGFVPSRMDLPLFWLRGRAVGRRHDPLFSPGPVYCPESHTSPCGCRQARASIPACSKRGPPASCGDSRGRDGSVSASPNILPVLVCARFRRLNHNQRMILTGSR